MSHFFFSRLISSWTPFSTSATDESLGLKSSGNFERMNCTVFLVAFRIKFFELNSLFAIKKSNTSLLLTRNSMLQPARNRTCTEKLCFTEELLVIVTLWARMEQN